MVEKGANISDRDNNGNTPLHIASLHNNIRVVEFLISININVNVRNNQGNTPINLACIAGNQYVIRALLKIKANVIIPNHSGKRPHVLLAENHNSTYKDLIPQITELFTIQVTFANTKWFVEMIFSAKDKGYFSKVPFPIICEILYHFARSYTKRFTLQDIYNMASDVRNKMTISKRLIEGVETLEESKKKQKKEHVVAL